jgi:hypothetical protein
MLPFQDEEVREYREQREEEEVDQPATRWSLASRRSNESFHVVHRLDLQADHFATSTAFVKHQKRSQHHHRAYYLQISLSLQTVTDRLSSFFASMPTLSTTWTKPSKQTADHVDNDNKNSSSNSNNINNNISSSSSNNKNNDDDEEDRPTELQQSNGDDKQHKDSHNKTRPGVVESPLGFACLSNGPTLPQCICF